MKAIFFYLLLCAGIASAQVIYQPLYKLSLSKAPGCRLDSTVFSDSVKIAGRIRYTYDGFDRLIKKETIQAFGNGLYTDNYQYDINDSIVEVENINSTAPVLQASKSKKTRDPQGRVTHDTTFQWSGGSYVAYLGVLYFYNQNGTLQENIFYSAQNFWFPSVKYQYQYDISGRLVSVLKQNYPNGFWENNSLTTYSYTQLGDVAQNLQQNWNSTSNSWDNFGRSYYVYTGTHRDSLVAQIWTTNNSWKFVYREITDGNGTLDSLTAETYTASQWKPLNRDVKIWSQSKLISLLQKAYSNGSWKNLTRSDFNYDAVGNNTINYVNDVQSLVTKLRGSAQHYYGCKGIVGIAETETDQIKIYPVPSDGIINLSSAIKLKEGTVYNQLGMEICRFSDNTVDLHFAPAGIYYLKLQTEEGQLQTRKVLIER